MVHSFAPSVGPGHASIIPQVSPEVVVGEIVVCPRNVEMRFTPDVHRSAGVDRLGTGWNDFKWIDGEVRRIEQVQLDLSVGELIFERAYCSI